MEYWDFIEVIMEIAVLAILEELAKAALCRAISWRSYWLVPVFAFGIFEAVLKFPLILALPSDIANPDLKIGLALLATFGTSIFHFYTSLLYALTRKLWLALALGSIVHIAYNVAVRFDSTFYVLDFKCVIFSWVYTTICGVVLFSYLKIEKSFAADAQT